MIRQICVMSFLFLVTAYGSTQGSVTGSWLSGTPTRALAPPVSTQQTASTSGGAFASVAARARSQSRTSHDVSHAWGYPIGVAGRSLGDGFWVRHGFTVENTWFNPAHWHTGEDWYAVRGDTAGAGVYAVAAGEVVYVGANYPGRVVIVEHDGSLFSMYGHLDPKVTIKLGQHVAQGDLLGTVLKRGDKVPNHLHFEIRSFLTTREVNGAKPRYGFRCGRNCPPGPGYWPIRAPELPVALGWRNPTHVIARRAFGTTADDAGLIGNVVVPNEPASASTTLWGAIGPDGSPRQPLGNLSLKPGQRFPLRLVRAGAEAPTGTGAERYQLWYNIGLPNGKSAWVQAAVSSKAEIGGDGRASSVRFNFFPERAAR